MLPRIDPTKSQPIYSQLMSEIKYFIAAGIMEPGDLLPSVREMAVALRINPNTVARAYRELEREGVVVTIRAKGVYVSDEPRVTNRKRALKEMKDALDALLVQAFHNGVAPEELAQLLEERIENLKSRRAN
jgi:GntR family transcriptional regulator